MAQLPESPEAQFLLCRTGHGESSAAGHRWIVIADSAFLPEHDGGSREHAGFVRAAATSGRLAALVVPADGRFDLEQHERLAMAPVLPIGRDTRYRHLFHRRTPFVVASRPADDQLPELLRRSAPDATGVVLFSFKAAEVGRRVAESLQLPVVLRQHNLEGPYHRALAQGMRGPRAWMLRWEAARVAAEERRLENAPWLVGHADISAIDAVVRAARSALPVVHVPPFAAGRRAGRAKPRAGSTVLFVGALSVATNRDALDWFLDEVWPTVRSRVPGAGLDVVGRRPPSRWARRLERRQGVSTYFDVQTVAPHLDSAAVAVNPTVSGSGVNIKVLDYVAHGIPVVSTCAAAAALGLRPGADLEAADDPDRFADAVVATLTDRVGAAVRAGSAQDRLAEAADPHQGIALLAELFEHRRPVGGVHPSC